MKRALWFSGIFLTFSVFFSSLAQDNPTKISDEATQRIAEQVGNNSTHTLLKKIKETETDLDEESLKHSERKNKTNQLFAIGSGAVGGNYFVLGELVGGVISHPIGSLPCGQGGTCGVPNLQTMNVTSAGSMANLVALKTRKFDSGFVQSDVAYWAYTGTGLYEKKNKMSDLRAIASLYPEAIHVVVNKTKSIKTVADLKGKRVSVGAQKSGTLLQARLVLKAYNLSEDDLQTEYLNNQQSIDKLTHGELDAMFFSVGAPAPALTQLFSQYKQFTLLSLDTDAQEKIFREGLYFSPHLISKNTYPNIPKSETISVYALWLSSAKTDENLVYQMTKALWHKSSRQLLDSSFIGRKITLENSLKGIGIPLHKGAKKYYNEIGKRF